VQTVTAGNAFSNPGLVITGDVLVMIVLAALVIVAALWRPVRQGAVLLAGAVVPMAAQAISAMVQIAETPSPAAFGISSAQARQLGLTISAGLTPAFWIYFGFLVTLIVSCLWMSFPPPAAADGAATEPAPTPPATAVSADADVAAADWAGPGGQERDDPSETQTGEAGGEAPAGSPATTASPEFETAPSGTTSGAREGDNPTLP
jgi:hypothetical protein